MKVGIVNRTQSVLAALKKTVLAVPGCRVAWLAHTGREAVAMCRADPPDLVLMDIVLSEMDGVEATRMITRESSCMVLLLTDSVSGSSEKVFQGLGCGAMDAVDLPMLTRTGAFRDDAELMRKIRMAATLVPSGQQPVLVPGAEAAENDEGLPMLIVVGVSTGGPTSIMQFLSALPVHEAVSLVIIQHMDVRFMAGYRQWLNGIQPWPVVAAEPGMVPEKGQVYAACEANHLLLDEHCQFAYTPTACGKPFQPSVDLFYESLATNWPETGIALLLTGMGRDGAQGLLTLRQKGWYTLAQDEASSVIYGMPRAAAELGAARDVLSLEAMPARIVELLACRGVSR